VHLSVAGYLTTAPRALPLAADGAATVLAGWNPDQTWWLTDIVTTTTSNPERWHYDRNAGGSVTGWRPAPTWGTQGESSRRPGSTSAT
jgi:hypothetical protein